MAPSSGDRHHYYCWHQCISSFNTTATETVVGKVAKFRLKTRKGKKNKTTKKHGRVSRALKTQSDKKTRTSIEPLGWMLHQKKYQRRSAHQTAPFIIAEFQCAWNIALLNALKRSRLVCGPSLRRGESRTSASFCILASDATEVFSQFKDAEWLPRGAVAQSKD